MARLTFTKADHTRIAGAIRQAEAATSGEIYAVFAHRSDAYAFVQATAVLAFALLAGLLSAWLGPVFGVPITAGVLAVCQLAAVIVLAIVLMLAPSLGMLLVPRAIAEIRAHRTALQQFHAHNLAATKGRTGILIFVSEAERYAEVVADDGIAAKVPQEAWDGIVAALIEAARDGRLADGYAAAAKAAGTTLTKHFPADDKNPNEIPDRLVVM